MMSVSHYELECPFWNICLIWGAAHTTKNGWPWNWATPQGKNIYFFLQVLGTFYTLKEKFKASFSFKLKQNYTRLAPISSWNIHVKGGGVEDMMWLHNGFSFWKKACGDLKGNKELIKHLNLSGIRKGLIMNTLREGTYIENWHTHVRTEYWFRGYLSYSLNYFGPYIYQYPTYHHFPPPYR